MRRALFVLILVFMPLQSIWAAAAEYCSHEATPATAHFGHHAHQHHGGADGDTSSDTGKASLDLDCHICHSPNNAVNQQENPPARLMPALQCAAAVRILLPSNVPERPERPNWPALA